MYRVIGYLYYELNKLTLTSLSSLYISLIFNRYLIIVFIQEAGSTIDENLCTIIVGIVNFMSTFIATALIDKLGRKILLYASSATMAITLITLGTFFNYKNNGYDVSQYGWLPLVSFVFFIIGFAIGFGPIPWLMMGEILPGKYHKWKDTV